MAIQKYQTHIVEQALSKLRLAGAFKHFSLWAKMPLCQNAHPQKK
jgi:hypothetical protein